MFLDKKAYEGREGHERPDVQRVRHLVVGTGVGPQHPERHQPLQNADRYQRAVEPVAEVLRQVALHAVRTLLHAGRDEARGVAEDVELQRPGADAADVLVTADLVDQQPETNDLEADLSRVENEPIY